tara:strand:+ start:1252 stop:1407 length:156 start_codon:yes stop_codon:yes gene_type:complete
MTQSKEIKKVKKILPKVIVQFTFKGKLNKVGESFRGSTSEQELLTQTKFIK